MDNLKQLKKRILVTGGAGFIGSNLCEAFLEEGMSVICFDNFLTGKRENVALLLDHPDFELVEGDIRDMEALTPVMARVDFVSHQAALGSVPRSIANPIPTSEINTQGFLNVLTAAKEANIKRFVYASSSSVYGDSKTSPKRENEIGKPLSPYAVSKLTNELYGALFFKLYGFETIGLRYFNVFGRKQDPNGVYAAAIPKFIDKFVTGSSPTIFGNGEQTRDFTHISNVIYANKRAILGDNSSAFGESFNVACGSSYSLNYVVDVIKTALQNNGVNTKGLMSEYLPERQGDIRDSLADISKIQSHLEYEVQTSFEDGMAEYVKGLMVTKSITN